MSVSRVLEQLFERFQQIPAGVHVTLLHPHSAYRTPLIAHLLKYSPHPVLYYPLGRDDTDLETFVRGISEQFITHAPLFGVHLNQLPPETWSHAPSVAEAFSADLRTLDQTPIILILDEYDRSDASDEIQQFLERIISALPRHMHMVINGRTLPRLPWVAMIARGDARILEDDHLVTEHFYGTPQHTGNALEVLALGPGFVVFNDRTIDNWEGHLPRLLFFFALDRPMITRSEICRAFWEDLDTDQAVNVFHVTKRRLHKALDADVLVHEHGYYRINPSLDLYYDTMQFVSLLLQGRSPTHPDRIDAYQRAVELYRGDFLQGHQEPWIVDRRASFQAGFLEALNAIADHWVAHQRPENALSVYQRAASLQNALHEDVHRKIIRLYLTMGRRSEAAAHLQRLEDTISGTGRTLELETDQLRDEILTQA